MPGHELAEIDGSSPMPECPEPLASGPRKGQPCGRPIRPGDTACGRHSQNSPVRLQKVAAQDQFLAAFAETGVLTAAAQQIGISRGDHYRWLEEPAYAEAFKEANEMAADVAERELWRRGIEGWDEPVFWKGEESGVIRRYSDACLFGVLKSRRPEKFRDGPRTLVTAGAGFDAQGNPRAFVQVEAEALADSFSAFRGAIDVDSSEAG